MCSGASLLCGAPRSHPAAAHRERPAHALPQAAAAQRYRHLPPPHSALRCSLIVWWCFFSHYSPISHTTQRMSRAERDDLWEAIGAPREHARWPHRQALEDDVAFLRGGTWDDINLSFEGASANMQISWRSVQTSSCTFLGANEAAQRAASRPPRTLRAAAAAASFCIIFCNFFGILLAFLLLLSV